MRLPRMTTAVAKRAVPSSSGMSRPEMAWTARRPMPLMENTVSVITAPERRLENCSAIMVTTGRSAFLRAWNTSTPIRVRPFARAVSI